jgi:hypothetical protein
MVDRGDNHAPVKFKIIRLPFRFCTRLTLELPQLPLFFASVTG